MLSNIGVAGNEYICTLLEPENNKDKERYSLNKVAG